MADLTHFDDEGRAIMVDVGAKESTRRVAVARGIVKMLPETLTRILANRMAKGDVFGVARLAGIMAAKKTSDLIPLCHPLMINSITVEFSPDPDSASVEIEAMVKVNGQTGVEMEALTAVSVAGLTIYDMCKAIDKTMMIDKVRLVEKMGGRSGHFINSGESINPEESVK
jgi:cyclic pyranopterin phosphate synthase